MVRCTRQHPLALMSAVGVLLAVLCALSLSGASLPGLVRMNRRAFREPISRALPRTESVPSGERIDRAQETCFDALHSIVFKDASDGAESGALQQTSGKEGKNSTTSSPLRWNWVHKNGCKPNKFSHDSAVNLLQCTRIVFVGDSVIRLIAQAVLRLVVSEEHPMPSFPRHEDVKYSSPCIKIEFLWRPYARNISGELQERAGKHSDEPETLVTGAALWDVLHVRSVQEYSDAIHTAQKTLKTLLEQGETSPHGLWWATPSIVHPKYLQTDEKRLTMTESNIEQYRAAQSSILLQELDGQDKFHVLDMHRITSAAPDSCAADGIHYPEEVYDAAANVLMHHVAAQPASSVGRACGPCDRRRHD